MIQFLSNIKNKLLGLLGLILGVLALVNLFKKKQKNDLIEENNKVNNEIEQLEKQKQTIDTQLDQEEQKRKSLEEEAKNSKELSNEDLTKFFNDRK